MDCGVTCFLLRMAIGAEGQFDAVQVDRGAIRAIGSSVLCPLEVLQPAVFVALAFVHI